MAVLFFLLCYIFKPNYIYLKDKWKDAGMKDLFYDTIHMIHYYGGCHEYF